MHRDLKPANILVDAEGQVKLLDFGIAKLLDAKSDQTGTAARVFTPDYAAPEQVRGERATTTTDVYALGVILYELLTGRRPYRIVERTPLAIERAVLTSEPQRPSGVVTHRAADTASDPDGLAQCRGLTPPQLRTRLRGDLDAIVLMALRKEPEARYRSVRDLSDDLRNVLAWLPVAARRGGLRYRADRFLRRNALAVILSIVAFLALGTGLVAALLQTEEAERQRDAAEREAATSREALRFMEDLFALVNPAETDGAKVTAQEVLTRGSERIRTELGDQPAIRVALLRAMGRAFLNLGMAETALPLLRESADLAREMKDAVASRESEAGLAEALQAANKSEEMLRRFPQVRLAFQPVTGRERIEAAGMDFQLGLAYYNSGDLEKARASIAAALEQRRALPDLAPHSQAIVAVYAQILRDLQRPEEALRVAREELERVRRSGSRAEHGEAIETVAAAEHGLGLFQDAELHMRQSLELKMSIYEPDHPRLLLLRGNLAVVLGAQHRYSAAADLLEENLRIRREKHAKDRVRLGSNLSALAEARFWSGDAAGAYDAAQEAVDLLRDAVGESHARTLDAQQRLGASALALGQVDEAANTLDAAIALREQASGPDDPALSFALEQRIWLDLARAGEQLRCARSERLLALPKKRASEKQEERESVYRRALHQACLARTGNVDAEEKLRALSSSYRLLALPGDPRAAVLDEFASGRFAGLRD